MWEHCIGDPYATADISYPFFLISDMVAKVFFGRRTLDYRRSLLEYNLETWYRPEKIAMFGTISETEILVLRTAVEKNDYNVIRKYIFRKGRRLLDMEYFSRMPRNC